MRGGGRVVLTHGLALHLDARILPVMLLDIGDKVHRNVVCERKGDGLAEADLTHAVIHADERAHIVLRQICCHAELFGHIFSHRRNKLGRRDQRSRVDLLCFVDGVSVCVILGRRFPRLPDGGLHSGQAERLAAVLDVGGQRGHAAAPRLGGVGVGRGGRDRQHIVQESARLPGFLLGFVRIFILRRLRLLFCRRKRFAHVARDIQARRIRLHALRKVKQPVKFVLLVLPEVGIQQNERKAGLVRDHRTAVAVKDLAARGGDRRGRRQKLRGTLEIFLSVHKLEVDQTASCQTCAQQQHDEQRGKPVQQLLFIFHGVAPLYPPVVPRKCAADAPHGQIDDKAQHARDERSADRLMQHEQEGRALPHELHKIAQHAEQQHLEGVHQHHGEKAACERRPADQAAEQAVQHEPDRVNAVHADQTDVVQHPGEQTHDRALDRAVEQGRRRHGRRQQIDMVAEQRMRAEDSRLDDVDKDGHKSVQQHFRDRNQFSLHGITPLYR